MLPGNAGALDNGSIMCCEAHFTFKLLFSSRGSVAHDVVLKTLWDSGEGLCLRLDSIHHPAPPVRRDPAVVWKHSHPFND